MTIECILDNITTLRMQEQSAYLIFPTISTTHKTHHASIRSTMAEWWINLLDVLGYPFEIAEIAMSYLDRYLSFESIGDNHTFRLLCVTCIYTAIKVHGHASVPPSSFCQLCQYTYTAEDIESMEYKLLAVLKWRMNPPTATSFLRLMVDLVPDKDGNQQVIAELAEYQIKQSMGNNKWIHIAAYIIAYCAFMNALEIMNLEKTIPPALQRMLQVALNVHYTDEYIENEIKSDLQELILVACDDKFDKVFFNRDNNNNKLVAVGSRFDKGSTAYSPRSIVHQ